MQLREISGAEIQKGTRVIVRADFDVTFKNGIIEDDFRIRKVEETLRFIREKGASLRIVTHRGRPEGKITPALSLKEICARVANDLDVSFMFVENPFDSSLKFLHSSPSEHFFFENIRFWHGEEKNDQTFAKELAEWGDIYVNEAFAASHRMHASLCSLPYLMPAFAGFSFAKEVEVLSRVMDHPERPLVVVLGGEKIDTKLSLVEHFLQQDALVLVGGALMNTLLAARGIAVGKSPVDKKFLENPNARVVNHKNLILPRDALVAKSAEQSPRVADIAEINDDEIIFDIGPESIIKFLHSISGAKTVVWNGPLGQAELAQFAGGTIAIAKGIQQVKGMSVVGGGHTISALRAYGLTEGITHVSTGGGAMLDFLAGKELPGLQALLRV